jgi:hypothetical protein
MKIQRRVQHVDSLAMFKAGYSFAKNHYILTFIYILGLLIIQFGTGFAVTSSQQKEFTSILQKIDIRGLENAKENAYLTYEEYRQSKGWFFTCDEKCTELYEISQQAKYVLDTHEASYNLAMSNARSKVGIFSQYGVEDARESWWDSFQKGISYAKRMSYMDALFLAIGSMRRDDSMLTVFLNWAIQAIMNFCIGMFSAFIGFAIHVAGLIFSYQTGTVSGIAFFILATSGAFAIVASFFVGSYLAISTISFAVLTATGGRIEYQTTGVRQRMRND